MSRARGGIDVLPSGAVRVRVYAGIDPVTRRRNYLSEVVPAGPQAERRARAVRDRLVGEVEERRNPRTKATVDQLLARYLEQFDGAPTTLALYRSYVRTHVSPLLGHVRVGQLDAEMLDSFYAELRRCRTHCTSRRAVDHRTSKPHECDERCGPHQCRPLGVSAVRHMHFLLSGAFKRAVRWRWVAASPVGQAEPPPAPKPNPQPPTPAEAARILTAAWRDPDWGALLWVAMTTGARRGELCALRWSAVELEEGRATIWLRRAARIEHDRLVEAELKTHQQRRIALDSETAGVLAEHRDRARARAASLDTELPADAFVFSLAPDSTGLRMPATVTRRYDRLASRLGIETTFHRLRHYSATELIAGGVDIRTVAGRLGHGGGGTTTLRTYTAWVSEADQRAARGLGAGMPSRPAAGVAAGGVQTDPRHPYERVAAAVARRVESGVLPVGSPAPTATELAGEHGISVATAKRAIDLVETWGLLTRDEAGRWRVAVTPGTSTAPVERPSGPVPVAEVPRYWSVTLTTPGGERSAPRTVRGDVADPESFRRHAVRVGRVALSERAGFSDEALLDDVEMEVREPGSDVVVAILRWD